MKFGSSKSQMAIILFVATFMSSSMAQSVKTVDAPYTPPVTTPAVKAEPDMPFAPAVKIEVAPKPIPSINLLPGNALTTQLQDMAKRAGWQLFWDAPDFSVDQMVPVSGDFVKALTSLIESANGSGTRLKANFYRGNNIVRVTEY